MSQSTLKKRAALLFLGTGKMLKGADALLYGTMDEAQEAAQMKLPGAVVTMPNGVSPISVGSLDGERTAILERFPELRGWGRTVLFFSRLHPKKGLDVLVEAFERIRHDFPDVGLFAAAIAQDEAYESTVRKRIDELQPANILLTTELKGNSARAVFAVSDIFCLPSYQEGFSIAILESLAAGLPVIISDKCHMHELDSVGVSVTVPVTVDGFEHGLRKMLSLEVSELAAMGSRARKIIDAKYTWERVADQLLPVYRNAKLFRQVGRDTNFL